MKMLLKPQNEWNSRYTIKKGTYQRPSVDDWINKTFFSLKRTQSVSQGPMWLKNFIHLEGT